METKEVKTVQGLVTKWIPTVIPDEAASGMLNVVLDTWGNTERRKGNVKLNATALANPVVSIIKLK